MIFTLPAAPGLQAALEQVSAWLHIMHVRACRLASQFCEHYGDFES